MSRNHDRCLRRVRAIQWLLVSSFLLAAMVSSACGQLIEPSIIATPLDSVSPANAGGTAPYYPTQILQAYGVDALQQGGAVNNGAGQTIAIVVAYHYTDPLSALNTFCAGYKGDWSLPTMSSSGSGPVFTQLNQNGGTTVTTGTNSSWAYETALDIEYAHAFAPQANIVLYEANSSNPSDLYAAVDAARNNPAVSVVSMSWGGSEVYSDKFSNSHFTTPGTRAVNNSGVTFVAATGDSGAPGDYPAMSPNVVAVGGTTLTLNADGSYASESAWSSAGGGTSSYQSKPSYQNKVTVGGGTLGSRGTPDVSMIADPSTGAYVYDPLNYGKSGWFSMGGTSLAAPCFAGLIADADEIRASAGLGTLDGATQTLPDLYSLSSADFYDVTTGNNGYSALAGYDLASGLGSPRAELLVPDLAGVALPVPEPAAISLLGAAVFAIAARRRKRRSR